MQTKKAIFSILFSSAFVWFLNNPVEACTFDNVMAGECPAHDVLGELLEEISPDRALLAARYAWTRHKDFKGKSDTTLNVCIFEKPAESVFPNVTAMPKVDFTNDPKGLTKMATRLSENAAIWSQPTANVGNKRFKSSISFVFFDDGGNVRTCENHKDSHILITINTGEINTDSSDVGFRYLHRAQRNPSKPKATMTFGASPSKTAIRHEFGHILGFVHEMGHTGWKECAEAFDSAAFANRAGVSEDKVKRAVLGVADRFKKAALVPSDTFDGSSIMAYRLRKSYFIKNKLVNQTQDSCSMTPSGKLTKEDKKLLLTIYRKEI